ncbi:MAG TPA: glycosyltransferase [Labilithrix sp.]|nr:glycosyltransferase [Labilithrix sp.]
MIVKNEAHVLARCLASVKPLLSAWVIVDTGSTDDTPAVARAALDGVPGEVIHRPWKNFGHNRSEALALSRPRADYSLVVDADDNLEFAPDVRLPELTHDAYALLVRNNGITYRRLHLLKNSRAWRYDGVLHEYPACDGEATRGFLDSVVYVRNHDGARWSDPQKYVKDAAVLEEALRSEPNNARYTFYLAQSYRDAKMPGDALRYYEKRTTMPGWDEEAFVAHHEAAKLREHLGEPFEAVQSAFLRAYEARPRRAEPLCELARFCRLKSRLPLAWIYALAASRIPRPDDALFVDEAVYAWRSLDELAVAAYHVGEYEVGRVSNARLIESGAVPAGDLPRIRDNLAWCERGLTGKLA